MFLRRVARSKAGTQESGARQWPQETAPPRSCRAQEGGKMETHRPQSKPLTSDVKLIGLPWLKGTTCCLFYLDKGSEVLVTQSCLTLCEPTDYIACQSPLLMGFPSQDSGVGCHSLLQGIVLTQGSNPGLLHCRQILYCLSHKGSTYVFIKTRF